MCLVIVFHMLSPSCLPGTSIATKFKDAKRSLEFVVAVATKEKDIESLFRRAYEC